MKLSTEGYSKLMSSLAKVQIYRYSCFDFKLPLLYIIIALLCCYSVFSGRFSALFYASKKINRDSGHLYAVSFPAVEINSSKIFCLQRNGATPSGVVKEEYWSMICNTPKIVFPFFSPNNPKQAQTKQFSWLKQIKTKKQKKTGCIPIDTILSIEMVSFRLRIVNKKNSVI